MGIKGRFWHLISVALLGALALEIVMILADGVRESFSVQRIPAHLATIAVGTILGWLYELLRQTNFAFAQTMREFTGLRSGVDSLTSRIRYQDEALAMLMHCPRHNEVLTSLIKTSMSDNFRYVPYVPPGLYLQFLTTALKHGDGYLGVQRTSLRWYREQGAGSYLAGLRDRPMSYKKRIFIVDDADVPDMLADLADQETLDYYWSHTGSVETYWIPVADFRKNYPKFEVPDDFALFDRQLLIAYDVDKQVLIFDLLNETRPELKIFTIQDELTSRQVMAFRPVPPDATAPLAAPA